MKKILFVLLVAFRPMLGASDFNNLEYYLNSEVPGVPFYAPSEISSPLDSIPETIICPIAITRNCREETPMDTFINGTKVLPLKSNSISDKNKFAAGQITALKWNTTDSDFQNYFGQAKIQTLEEKWDLELTLVTQIRLQNEKEYPLAFYKLSLLSASGDVLWESSSDLQGKAALFLKRATSKQESLVLKIVDPDGHKVYEALLKAPLESHLNITLEEQCIESFDTEIMFVIDGTGSMADEINYLQEELKTMLSSVPTSKYGKLKTGAVFYRDEHEEYLQRTFALSENINSLYDFIKAQKAEGGGDIHESLTEGLKAAINQKWGNNSLKVVFLLTDAPARLNSKTELGSLLKTASAQGIKIISISASESNREAEFLLNKMSQITGGAHIYITDDSQIGNDHLISPVSGAYVFRLDELMVEEIEAQSRVESCEEETQENISDLLEWSIYPNPATDFIRLRLNQDVDRVYLKDGTGKRILQIPSTKGEHNVDLDQLISGTYTLTIQKNDKEYSKQVILITH